MTVLSCILCGSPLVTTFVDLGMSPPCESFVPRSGLEAAETFYPLHVRICDECLLVQLPAYLPAHKLSWVPDIEPKIHVAIRADTMRQASEGVNIPVKDFVFGGLSGGLAWQRQSDGVIRAVAIMIEHHSQQKLLIGTVIAPLLFRLAQVVSGQSSKN